MQIKRMNASRNVAGSCLLSMYGNLAQSYERTDDGHQLITVHELTFAGLSWLK